MNPSIFDEDGGRPCIDCPEYVSLDAADKLERIWAKILDYEYPELPTDWLHSRADRITTDSVPDRERVNMIFDRVSDERPPNFPRMLHEYGSIARVAFVPAQPLGSHAFTGFYGEGNELGIIRVTFCAPMDGAKLGLRVPFAFAAKFLRDGIHSSNILTCEQQGVEGAERDPSMFSVFKHVLHTSATIPQPADRFFSLAQNQTGTLSVADNTWFWKNGSIVEKPVTPLIIHYFPNDALNTKEEYDEDFRLELLEIPEGSVLYTAYTEVDDEGDSTICICHETDEGGIPCSTWDSLNERCNLVELGSLVLRSRFVHSDYGDNGILFKHYRACQEKRQFCEYDGEIPYEESTYSQSSHQNGICLSQRRVPNMYECPSTFGNDGSSVGGVVSKIGVRSYCSSEDEYEKEKMCPFAKMLHPTYSSHGSPYPIGPQDQYKKCTIGPGSLVGKTRIDRELPLVQVKCCRSITEYFDESVTDKTGGTLQELCSNDECRNQFQTSFPDIDLNAECESTKMLNSCKFEIRAGPQTIPINLGFVADQCCSSAQIHSNTMAALDERETALVNICVEGDSCIYAYGSLFQQGQAFSNPSSDETLASVCATMSEDDLASPNKDDGKSSSVEEAEETIESDISANAGISHLSTWLAMTMSAPLVLAIVMI
mmetsp:Transcript_4804/g.10761  ORF Transcript_4804/g.10761 Transcript_4804/m.10761 type:complete len:656 (+) Transcript_4804:564-2531(+)